MSSHYFSNRIFFNFKSIKFHCKSSIFINSKLRFHFTHAKKIYLYSLSTFLCCLLWLFFTTFITWFFIFLWLLCCFLCCLLWFLFTTFFTWFTFITIFTTIFIWFIFLWLLCYLLWLFFIRFTIFSIFTIFSTVFIWFIFLWLLIWFFIFFSTLSNCFF